MQEIKNVFFVYLNFRIENIITFQVFKIFKISLLARAIMGV